MDNPTKPRSKEPRARVTLRKKPVLRTEGLRGIGMVEVERAAGDLRAGVPVLVTGPQDGVLIMSAETMSRTAVEDVLVRMDAAPPHLLLTPERARALKIRLYTPDVLAVPMLSTADAIFALRDLANPARDLSNPLRGPFNARREAVPAGAASALRLLKIASLLPAGIGWFVDKRFGSKIAKALGVLSIPSARVDEYEARKSSELFAAAQANLPLAGAENTRILAFRPPSGAREHLVLMIGNPSPDRPPLVRIHSECFTGDLLGSLKCDCGDQLRGAIRRMGSDAAGGVLLYLAQEGRGIGLINKLRAYDLQDQGFDTVDANTRLGFEPDERQFSVAVEILTRLGFSSIRLLTNNPDKVAALNGMGVTIVERVAHSFPSNPHNADYLQIKARKSGHIL